MITNGHYKVNDQIFENKFHALIEATRINVAPTWHYFDEIFQSADKTNLGQISLSEWYRQRALQLRDKYDYLVLNYSGGSDSHNILHTFLKNNIKLDCIFVQWHISLTDKNLYTVNNIVKTNDNFHSEWDLTIKKDLEWLSATHPEIKIEIKDWTSNVNEKFYNDKLFDISAGVMPNISRGPKLNIFSDIETAMVNKGLKVASIFGVDKPNIIVKDETYYFYFNDKSCMTQPNPENPHGLEYFYISPDMPQLTIEQSYALAKWFKKQNDKKLIKALSQRTDIANYTLRDYYNEYESYCETVKLICYPYWDFNRFQAGKPMPNESQLLSGLKLWDNILIKANILDRSYHSYNYHWNSYLNLIDEKYLRGREPIGLKTKWHYLGKF